MSYEKHAGLLSAEGHRNVIRAHSSNTAGYYPLIGVRVDLEDLANVGIIPDDNTPPLISMKACWTRTYESDHDGIQIFYLLRYGTSTSVIYNSSQDVLFNSSSGSGAYLGAGDNSWDHTVTAISTDDKQGWKHEGIPLPATYNGKPLTAVVINLLGKAKAGYAEDSISLEGVDFAVVPGATIDSLDPYLNKPDDYPKVQNIEESQLSQTLRSKLVFVGEGSPNLITIKNSDKITILGDSYSASHYTQKDKAYISRLAELTDWRIENFSRSGDDYSELNERILTNIAEYHPSLSFKDYGSTFALLISWTNDAYARTSDTYYWFDNIKRLMETVKACGVYPLLSTEFVGGSMFEFAGIGALAREQNVPFFDIMSNAYTFNETKYSQYWGGGHPAVRTNGLIYEPLLKYIDALPRPKQSIKLFRKRPVFALSSDQDLLYDDIPQRVKRWQEITVGHVSLVDRLAPYYDRMDDIVTTHGGYSYSKQNSEYLQLQSNDIVNFGDYMLVEVILPTTAAKCSSVKLNFGVVDAEVYVRNALPALNYSAYTKHQVFEVNEPVGVVPGDQYAVNGETLTIVAEVMDHDGTYLIIASTYKWDNGGAGTLTKVSGTGPSSINFNATRYGFEPEYYDLIGKPRGEWMAVANEAGSALLSQSHVQKAMSYDKVIFMLKKQGGLLVSDINVEWVGIEGKPPKINPMLEPNSRQSQVLQNTSFVDMTNWNIVGVVNPTVPHDGVLPKGLTKMVNVSQENRLLQNVDLSHASRYSQTIDIVVWARRYPLHFNPSSNEATAAVEYLTAPITSESCDYTELSVRLFDGQRRDGVIFKSIVGLHWQECRFRIDIGSNNIARDGVDLEVFCEDDELEIALVEVWV
ncbi:SGNH/GDSL hydrolase family protein [Pseudoalteromonas sp. T1lg22]|uniref:SGNH/GDSL hydrolase family protein n=1 Tax=Pseudoalteromonas sp. T1lg22 TaxID=2077096 RepID=UPI000CF69A3D|nr:SGNH/GDSL hydrolase family protein [Pseudoalteromonas sp. T1lg22]